MLDSHLLPGGRLRRKREGTCEVCDRVFDDFLNDVRTGEVITAKTMQEIDPIYKIRLVEFICLRAIDDK